MSNRTAKRVIFGSGLKDLLAILSVIVLGAGLFCLYWYILRHDPAKDAKKLIDCQCKCNEAASRRKIGKYQEFLKTFNQQHFKKQQLARNQYQTLGIMDDSLQNCISNARAMYTAFRSYYLSDPSNLRIFDSVIADISLACEEPHLVELMPLEKQISDKIDAMSDGEPDSNQIKVDILGKNVPGWRFDSYLEFKGLRINSVERSNNLIQYNFTLFLLGGNPQIPATCELVASYNHNHGQWLFKEIKEKSITITYTAPLNEWATVNHPENCNYTMNSHNLRYWIGESVLGSAMQIGPDVPMPHLTSNVVYIKSREDVPVAVDFTYYPQNQNQ